MFSVIKGRRPPRPLPQSCRIRADLANFVWGLIKDRWRHFPSDRLTAGDVVMRLRFPGGDKLHPDFKKRSTLSVSG